MTEPAPGATRHHLVSHRLRQRRVSLGLTQHQVVARLARLGVSTTNKALSSLEHGAGLDAAKLPELAGALECSVTYLLALTDDPGRWEPDSAAGAPEDRAPDGTDSSAPRHGRSWILGPDVPDLRPQTNRAHQEA